MLDTLVLQLFIKTDLISQHLKNGSIVGGEFPADFLLDHDINLSGRVTIDENGNRTIGSLSMPFASLPSSYSKLAYKYHVGGKNYFPHFEIKASPAKLHQGHNVYGTDCLRTSAFILISEFIKAQPYLADYIEFKTISVKQIDITYSAHVSNSSIALQYIDILKTFKTGNIKPTNVYKTAVMFNGGSKKIVREIYLKEDETKKIIDDLTAQLSKPHCPDYVQTQLNILQSDEVQNYAKNCIRFEAKIKRDYLVANSIPIELNKLITYFENMPPKFLWLKIFQPILDGFKDCNMHVYNDAAVHDKLKSTYLSMTKNGVSYAKANRLFQFYRSLKNDGYDYVKANTQSSTFYDNLKLLTIAVPKSHLVRFTTDTDTNVVPLFKVVNVDFQAQSPTNWKDYKDLMLA